MPDLPSSILTRRRFLTTSATAAAALYVPWGDALAASARVGGRRYSLADTNSYWGIVKYDNAVRAMLALPPTDPRNWYRNAFTHLMDCPHGNWWFLPWHRGYLGWLEQTCAEFVGEPRFALPFWDWTTAPRIPEVFTREGVALNPNTDIYIASFETFRDAFATVVDTFYTGVSHDQHLQLVARGLETADKFWARIGPSGSMFFPQGSVRTLTRENPDFDAHTAQAVSPATINQAFASATFQDWGSHTTAQHSVGGTQGILESQPHNNVHDATGGFMGNFLSPVDPLFFCHHANIDRLWWLWTAKQVAAGLPTTPTGSDLGPWQSEPFLFYVDAQGEHVTQDTAGDYAEVGAFDYDYGPGFVPTAAAPSLFDLEAVEATLLAGAGLVASASTGAQATVPRRLLLEAAKGEDGPVLVAEITLRPGMNVDGHRFDVFVNAPGDAAGLGSDSPSFAGSIAFFGTPHHGDGTQTFTVPLSGALRALQSAGTLDARAPLSIQVVPQRTDASTMALDVSVEAIHVRTL